MEYYAHPLLEKIMKEKENKVCNDCGIGHPIWASINNGVLLCLNCAGIHRGFGVQVSIIRSLTMDNWDDRQITFLMKGGNKRFNELMKEYCVPDNAGPEFKYMISATNYYRKLLRAEVTNETVPEKPDSINGLELLDFGNNNYTNITNSEPITNESVIRNDFKSAPKQTSFFSKIGGFFGEVKSSLSEKIKDSNIREKIKQTGEKAIIMAKSTSNYVMEKGKEAYNTNFVQNLAHKTEEGLNKIVYKAKKVFVKDEIMTENNTNNTSDCSLNKSNDVNQSYLSNYRENSIKNEVQKEEKNLSDLKEEQK